MIGWLEQEGEVKQMSVILADVGLNSRRTRPVCVEHFSDIRRDEVVGVELEFVTLFV